VKKSLLFFILPFLVFAYFSFILSQQACDNIMSNDAQKDAPFNHKSHLASKSNSDSSDYGITGCEDCHQYAENGRFLGIPKVSSCTGCHGRGEAVSGPDKLVPKRKPFLDAFKDSDKPWESFAKQPDLVYFSHKVVMTAKRSDGSTKARCISCHGDKAGSTNTAKIKGKMLMGQCMDCHTALKISNKCAVCHD
jgi:hypothetical protein